MMKRWIYLLLIVLLVTVAGCSNDDAEADTESTTDSNQTSENSDDTEVEEETDEDVVVLEMGETGSIDADWAKFDVTVHGVESIEIENFRPSRDHILKVDVTIKNTSDEPVDVESINDARIEVPSLGELDNLKNYSELPEINHLVGEIAPNESMSGEVLFEANQADSYKVLFGGFLGTEYQWPFTIE